MDPHQAEGMAAITAIHQFYGGVNCVSDRKVFKSRKLKELAMTDKTPVSCEQSVPAEDFNCHSDLELQRAAA